MVMKNIHILPTDKPSRLYKQVNKLKLRFIADSPIDSDISINQHIYITSDEEIKEGDWVFNFEYNYIVRYDSKKHDDKFWYKKIILTTDKSLDCVQPIDDEFLEWFVKNPNCEFVNLDTFSMGDKVLYNVVFSKEEPKQETLEEAAEKYASISFNRQDLYDGFIAGAKWQAERMYSEEEVFNLCGDFATFVQQKRPSYKKQLEWFEQFKKK